MLFLCWANVVDGGPTSKQHWFNVLCLLGEVMDRSWLAQTAQKPGKTNPTLCNAGPASH